MHNEILSEIKGSLGVITLNRPKALNALSIGMVKEITRLLKIWESDPKIEAVYFKGEGSRAFCAGGDIKQVYRDGLEYRAGRTKLKKPIEMLYHEYRMNRLMHHYTKPMAVFMHGITMGGGYGIAGNCDVRIVRADSVFAMPETGIGFFTDVGSVHHLHECPHHIGRYLVLSGQTINAGDMVFAGIATHAVNDDPDEAFILAALLEGKKGASVSDLPAGDVEENAEILEKHFNHEQPGVICASLAGDASPWARDALDAINKRSALSVRVCAEHYARSAAMNFDDVMAADFTLAQHFMDCPDFYEGIRSVLIDRDGAPDWSYRTLAGVPDSMVQQFFMPREFDLNDEGFSSDDT